MHKRVDTSRDSSADVRFLVLTAVARAGNLNVNSEYPRSPLSKFRGPGVSVGLRQVIMNVGWMGIILCGIRRDASREQGSILNSEF